MQADFWLERWQQNQIGFHQSEINIHLQNYWDKLEIPATSKIFVPLCGKSRDLLWLRSRGHEVLGVEISPLAVKNFFLENNLEPQVKDFTTFQVWQSDGLGIILGDFFELDSRALTGCNTVYDRASLVALPPQMRRLYVEHLMSIAASIKDILLITFAYNQNKMAGPPFSVTGQEVQVLFAEHFQIEALYQEDVLEQNAVFRESGLSQFLETIYWLKKHSSFKR